MHPLRPSLILPLLAAAFLVPAAAAAQASPVSERDGRSTLFYIGDSTVRNGSGNGGNGQWGWGSVTDLYFDTTKVRIANRAIGGRSSRTFFTEGRWDRVLEEMRPGDVVVIQFGHNDGGLVNDTARARGSLRGVGEETQEIDNLMTKRHEVVHTYGWYLRRYVADARAKGATPVIASHVPRNIRENGAFVRNHDTYAGWAAEVARAEGVPFIDLNELIAREFDRLGPETVAGLFQGDHTHTNLEGAKLNARIVVAALKGLPENPVAAWLSSEGQAVGPLAP